MLDEIEEKLKSSAVNGPTSSKKKQTELTDDDKGELSQEDYEWNDSWGSSYFISKRCF